MKTSHRLAFVLVASVAAAQAAAQVTFYEHEGFEGRSFSVAGEVRNLERTGFNDRASAVVVQRGRWEVCEDRRFAGRCVVLRRGEYPSLAAMGLNDGVSSVREVGSNVRVDDDRYAPPARPVENSQISFYEHPNYEGRAYTANDSVPNLRPIGFERAVSSVVLRGGQWEMCDQPNFRGQCVVLRRGQYPDLRVLNMDDRIASVRAVRANERVDEGRYGPQPVAVYDYGQRPNERLYQADITAVRAVVANQNQQRCWVEREQVTQNRGSANVPGALLGAVIGGILGHQVGGGSGRDAATAVGVVAGAAVGGNTNRDRGSQVATQDVQRCTSAPQQLQPDYYDVTYNFRGMEHRVQMATPPGATLTVNERGEPRA